MSQGEKSILIKAGQQALPVRAAGDFIFLKESARPVRVIVDGQPITMRAGDKRVLPRRELGLQAFSSFEVDNPHEADLRVVFVVGDGDYNSQIVHGEMNVSAYVATSARGVAASLPMTVERVVGVENETQQVYTVGQQIYTTGAIDVAPVWYFSVWFVDRWYIFASNGNRYEVKKDTPNETLHFSGVWAAVGTDYRGATITPEGVIYFRTKTLLYKMSIGSMVPSAVSLQNAGGFEIVGLEKVGMHYWRGRIYARASAGGNPIISIDINGGDLRIHRTDIGDMGYLVGLRDRLYSIGSVGGNKILNILDNFEIVDTGLVHVVTSVRHGALDDSGLYALDYTNINNGYRIAAFRSVTVYGRLYLHPVGDVNRKEIIDLYSPLSAYDTKAGRVAVHGWVGAILRSLGGGENYRDYLTGYSFDNGVIAKEIGSGTQTFSYRGLDVPDFPALDGSTIKINILPDYF